MKRPSARSVAAGLLVMLGLLVMGHSAMGYVQGDVSDAFARAFLPAFLTVGIIELVGHLVVAMGILAGRFWGRIGGMVLSGLGLLAYVPVVVAVLAIPDSLRLSFSYLGLRDERLLVLLLVISSVAAIGYAVVLVLLVRLESART